MDNKYIIFAFTEEEIAIIMQALTFFGDADRNKWLTDEQFELVQKTLTAIDNLMF